MAYKQTLLAKTNFFRLNFKHIQKNTQQQLIMIYTNKNFIIESRMDDDHMQPRSVRHRGRIHPVF